MSAQRNPLLVKSGRFVGRINNEPTQKHNGVICTHTVHVSRYVTPKVCHQHGQLYVPRCPTDVDLLL